jgi:hypothetical protein
MGLIDRIKTLARIKTNVGPEDLASFMARLAHDGAVGLKRRALEDGAEATERQWLEVFVEFQAAFHAAAALHAHRFLQGELFRRFGASMVIAAAELDGYIGAAFRDSAVMESRVKVYLFELDEQTRADLLALRWIVKDCVDIPCVLLARVARIIALDRRSPVNMTLFHDIMGAFIALYKEVLNSTLLPVLRD